MTGDGICSAVLRSICGTFQQKNRCQLQKIIENRPLFSRHTCIREREKFAAENSSFRTDNWVDEGALASLRFKSRLKDHVWACFFQDPNYFASDISQNKLNLAAEPVMNWSLPGNTRGRWTGTGMPVTSVAPTVSSHLLENATSCVMEILCALSAMRRTLQTLAQTAPNPSALKDVTWRTRRSTGTKRASCVRSVKWAWWIKRLELKTRRFIVETAMITRSGKNAMDAGRFSEWVKKT